MRDLMIQLLNFMVPTFAVASMLSVGLAYSAHDILSHLKNWRLAVAAVVVNFLFVPLLALFISGALEIGEAYRIGLFLLAVAGGAPFLITLTAVARGNIAMSAALLVLLLGMTIVLMPAAISQFVPGARVSSASIGVSLALTMLLPLVLGVVFKEWRPITAARGAFIARAVSSFALVGLVSLTVLVHFSSIIEILGSGAILAGLLLTGGAFVGGYVSGGRDSDQRETLGLATSQRNVAAATVVATQDFADPDILVMVIVTSLVALSVLFPVAWWLQKKKKGRRSKESYAGA